MNELMTPEERALELKRLVSQLQAEGRKDLLLKAIGVPLLEELRIEAAKGKLSKLVITEDYRFVLADYNQEVELQFEVEPAKEPEPAVVTHAPEPEPQPEPQPEPEPEPEPDSEPTMLDKWKTWLNGFVKTVTE
jgi:outer membrane biosynthesis protein TonB